MKARLFSARRMAANCLDSSVGNSELFLLLLLSFFFCIWEHDECSFAKETTLDV